MKILKKGCLVFVVFFALLGVVGSLMDDEVVEDENEISDSYAYFAAKESIKEVLKAPSTAEFADYSDSYIRREGNTFYVDSYVDSQNSFGAMLRKKFRVKIMFNDDSSYTYSIQNFE